MLRNTERPMQIDLLPQPQITAQNRPAQHRRAVYLCADDRYAPFSLFLAHQNTAPIAAVISIFASHLTRPSRRIRCMTS
jgi:hypothetical protein